MRRFIGNNIIPEHSDNSEIFQSGGTNYPTMIADVNSCGEVKYIHWISEVDFTVSEILCYGVARLTQSEITTSSDYFSEANMPITNLSDCKTMPSYLEIKLKKSYDVSRVYWISRSGMD